ncbi:MAG: SCO family protein [Chromatiales bacterium]|nr:SCO family protein [Gammaproteobacteria bacterium]
MQRIFLLGVIVLLSGLLIWVALFWAPQPDSVPSHEQLSISATPVGGNFALESHLGPVSLNDYRGKVVILYFGYTWCPDICPTSLGFLSMALNELTEDELAGVQPLFISVDPKRDSLERLRVYGEYFHPSILGVTGLPEAVEEAAEKYGAAYSIVEQLTESNYVVDHSADTYFIDREGELTKVMPHGTPPEEMLALMRRMLSEGAANQ